MKMSLRNGLLLLFLGISATVLCYGQLESGQLTGTITDPSGAVVSGAKITLTNSGTGQTRAVTSGANGTYFVTSLTPAV